jgi:hypothetical protein
VLAGGPTGAPSAPTAGTVPPTAPHAGNGSTYTPNCTRSCVFGLGNGRASLATPTRRDRRRRTTGDRVRSSKSFGGCSTRHDGRQEAHRQSDQKEPRRRGEGHEGVGAGTIRPTSDPAQSWDLHAAYLLARQPTRHPDALAQPLQPQCRDAALCMLSHEPRAVGGTQWCFHPVCYRWNTGS